MPFGRKSPLEALALPGVILAYKYSQFRQRRREAASRRVTERELSALHHKIDKLLNKLEESEPELPTSQEDECVICINARATMQTSPCGHRVVCRRCFVKTIQSAVSQRLLPLRCVICRARVNRLTSSSGSWRIQESASSYSVGGKSWSSIGTGNSSNIGPNGFVPQSASSYSMGHEHTTQQQQQQQQHHHHNHRHNHNHAGSGNNNNGRNRVTQSASLYSMQSGTSSLSNSSNATSCSNTSSASSGIDISSESSSSSVMSSGSSVTSINNINNINRSQHNHNHNNHHHHHHNNNNQSTCQQNGCLGAIPRKPNITLMSNGSTNTYPGRRYTKGRIADLQQNRLPPIKEFRSPIHHQKVPAHTSPAHLNNPRFRYSSYTKSPSSHEMVPLLKDSSPTRITLSTSSTTTITTNQKQQQNIICGTNKSTKIVVGLTSKVNPIASKIPIQKNGLTSPQNIKNINKKVELNNHPSSSKCYSLSNINYSGNNKNSNNNKAIQNNNNRNLHQDEKADNKKNETMEKKKKEEKLKLKAEKEARKEEKRLAKEEERLAKLLAKEEKKKGKREAKELLLAHDGNNKK